MGHIGVCLRHVILKDRYGGATINRVDYGAYVLKTHFKSEVCVDNVSIQLPDLKF